MTESVARCKVSTGLVLKTLAVEQRGLSTDCPKADA